MTVADAYQIGYNDGFNGELCNPPDNVPTALHIAYRAGWGRGEEALTDDYW